MSDTLKRTATMLTIVLIATSVLAGCGKKGKLENDESQYPRTYPNR